MDEERIEPARLGSSAQRWMKVPGHFDMTSLVRRRPRGKMVAAVVVAAAIAVGIGSAAAVLTSSSTPSRIKVQSPLATVVSWFDAINDRNQALAVAHFSPADQDQMEWSAFGTSSFQNLRCHDIAVHSNNATVYCSFQIRNPTPDLKGDSFWTVDMTRARSGPWLITSYGTG